MDEQRDEEVEKVGWTERQANRQVNRQTDRKMDGQTDRWTGTE